MSGAGGSLLCLVSLLCCGRVWEIRGKELGQQDKAGGLGRLRTFVICHLIRKKFNVNNRTAWHAFSGHRLRDFDVLERVWHFDSHTGANIYYEMLAIWKPPFPLLWKEGDHESSLIRLSWAATTQSSPWYFLSDLTHCTGTGSSFQSWNWRMLQVPQLKCCLRFFFWLFFQVEGEQNLLPRNTPL